MSEVVEALAKRLAASDKVAGKPINHNQLAQDCIDAITHCGYAIQHKPSADLPAERSNSPATPSEFNERLLTRTKDLLKVWRQFSGGESVGSPQLYAKMGERLLASGEPLLAYDVIQSALQHSPSDVRLRQLLALSLARSSAPRRAASLLRELLDEGHDDEETLSLLARTYKDLWEAEPETEKKQHYLRQSHDLYRRGYEKAIALGSQDGTIYAGINAATTAMLLGDQDFADRAASLVAKTCHQKTEEGEGADYWSFATLGECALIAGDYNDAKGFYHDAAKLAVGQYANLASTRRNAKLILTHQGKGLDFLSECFSIPKVAVFSGHLIDRPGMEVRFPHAQIKAVRLQLQKAILENQIGFGFAAAGCGGDLVFLEELGKLQGESHVVLPLASDTFVQTSVAIDQQLDWRPIFDKAIGDAAQVVVVNDFSRTADPVYFEYANQVMTGLAILHAASLDTELLPIAVWDHKPARGPGGTGSAVQLWRQLGLEPFLIHPFVSTPDSLTSQLAEFSNVNADSASTKKDDQFEMEIRAMLFADVVGYSKITEEEIPIFVKQFMCRLAKCVQDSGVHVESSNTWGDAIYFVFRSVEQAGLTALLIADYVRSTDWVALGLRNQLNLRTGLHVGPVYHFRDPFTQAATHTGAHVSRAARIEPITPAGEVYASEAFAAVAAAENVKSFECDYVGITPMAKGYGDFATYHVRRVIE